MLLEFSDRQIGLDRLPCVLPERAFRMPFARAFGLRCIAYDRKGYIVTGGARTSQERVPARRHCD
jgi:hypothetical protein